MTTPPLQPEPIVPRNLKPVADLPIRGGRSKVVLTDEGKIANEIKALPDPREFQQIAAAVAAKAAKDILLGNLPFKSAGEASKVARDFAAIAKDFSFDIERESIVAAETAEDRKDALAAFRARALENLDTKLNKDNG